MHTTLRRAIATAIVLPVLALTAACGSDDDGGDKASDTAGEKAVEKAIESGTDEGTTSYGSKDRPESLPEDFPMPEGEILTSMDSPTGAMVSMKPEGDLKEAFDEMVADLEDQGWKREYLSEAEGASSAMMSGEGKDESVVVNVDLEAGEMTFVVSLAS